MKNENTLLINTLKNTLHALKKRSPIKKQLPINRVNREINNITTNNFHITAQQKTPIIIEHYLHVTINLYYFIIVFQNVYISYSNVSEISYFKDITICISKRLLSYSLKMAL